MPSLNNATGTSKERWPDLAPHPRGGRLLRGLAAGAILALMPFAMLLVGIVQILMRLMLWRARDI